MDDMADYEAVSDAVHGEGVAGPASILIVDTSGGGELGVSVCVYGDMTVVVISRWGDNQVQFSLVIGEEQFVRVSVLLQGRRDSSVDVGVHFLDVMAAC